MRPFDIRKELAMEAVSRKFDGWPHVIESQQFSREWLTNIFFPLAREMKSVVANGGSNMLVGKKMVVFFYEPSTRTRVSFQMAMEYLGGRVVFTTENASEFSSVVKGENVQDTFRVLGCYKPDVIVSRFGHEGDAKVAANVSLVPVVNAGDGRGQHPTQALLDIFTIINRFNRVCGFTIAMVGDLANGRTVRSLCYLLGKFTDIKIHFVAPRHAGIGEDIKDYLRRHQVRFFQSDDLRAVAPEVDVVYQTRTQKERGGNIDRSDLSQGFFIVNEEVADSMKQEAIIMHPLPRNEEITPGVDINHRAVYLKDQVENGLYTRMALLQLVLGV